MKISKKYQIADSLPVKHCNSNKQNLLMLLSVTYGLTSVSYALLKSILLKESLRAKHIDSLFRIDYNMLIDSGRNRDIQCPVFLRGKNK